MSTINKLKGLQTFQVTLVLLLYIAADMSAWALLIVMAYLVLESFVNVLTAEISTPEPWTVAVFEPPVIDLEEGLVLHESVEGGKKILAVVRYYEYKSLRDPTLVSKYWTGVCSIDPRTGFIVVHEDTKETTYVTMTLWTEIVLWRPLEIPNVEDYIDHPLAVQPHLNRNQDG